METASKKTNISWEVINDTLRRGLVMPKTIFIYFTSTKPQKMRKS